MCEYGNTRGFCMSKEKRGQAMTMRGAEIMSRRTYVLLCPYYVLIMSVKNKYYFEVSQSALKDFKQKSAKFRFILRKITLKALWSKILS